MNRRPSSIATTKALPSTRRASLRSGVSADFAASFRNCSSCDLRSKPSAAANWPDSREPVLIVGHQPTLGVVAARLLSETDAPWSLRKGSVWWLSNRARESGAGVLLKAVMAPDFL